MLQHAVNTATRGSSVRIEFSIEDFQMDPTTTSSTINTINKSIDPLDFNSTLKCSVTHEAEDTGVNENLQLIKVSARGAKDESERALSGPNTQMTSFGL